MNVKLARLGDWMPKDEIKAFNRTGGTLNYGDVVALDLTGSDGDVSTYAEYLATPNNEASPLANVIAVGSAAASGWILLVAQETIADNAKGNFLLKGLTQVNVVGSSAVAIGGRLAPTSGQKYLSAEADGLAVCGIALQAGPTGGTPDLTHVVFDGWCISGPQAEV